ncbi:site-specific DNA-methyltransferase [Salinisphaera sp. P385]|uniref:Methyltransferase n=1 Tax=Spectribacter acetivorans TaxID=3075603 RepID=A0ABU3B9G4_9GAMM|nr:site-specific DNA-methyltransferase [Salinisphaera sp. P385]MDT0618452.1 site-specific DNA-methyltransferase [Salinisphaera sp. P385]
MERTLAEGGVLFLQVGATKDDQGRLLPMGCLLLEHLRGMGLTLQNRVIWTIGHGLTPRRRLAARHEVALILSKGEPAHFNVNAARIAQKQPGKRAFKGPRRGQLSGHPLGAHPTDVWNDIANIGHNHPEKTGHPAQFPSALVERAVRLYTMPGELVCDAFDGSGTTTATAKREGRSFIGADLFYEDMRAQRLAATRMGTVCKLPGVTDESVAVWQAEAVASGHIAAGASKKTQQLVMDIC